MNLGSSLPARADDGAGHPAPEPDTRSFDLSYVIKMQPPQGMHKVRVWIPLPSSDASQTISELQVTAPVKVHMHRDGAYGNRYAYFTEDADRISAPFEIRVAFHVDRLERRADFAGLSQNSQDPYPKEVERFLQPDKLLPVNGFIASLTAAQIQGLTDPLAKARKIYEYVVSTMHYAPSKDADQGDAVRAANSHTGSCTDFQSLFIAMARAAGIPARFQVGFSLPEQQKEGTILGYHSWAEFWLNGAGWVPLDAFDGRQNPDKRDYFFGSIDAQRVMLSLGRDVDLSPSPDAGTLNYMVYPYIEVDGQAYSGYSTDIFFQATGMGSATPSKRPIVAERRQPATPTASQLSFAS